MYVQRKIYVKWKLFIETKQKKNRKKNMTLSKFDDDRDNTKMDRFNGKLYIFNSSFFFIYKTKYLHITTNILHKCITNVRKIERDLYTHQRGRKSERVNVHIE